MYYNRTIPADLESLLSHNGEMRWLYNYVKNNDELDFLTGKNNSNEWISIYYGLTRILTICRKSQNSIYVSADIKYRNLVPGLFGERIISVSFQADIECLLAEIKNCKKFNRYYRNEKEGYYQNELSRKYGMCGCPDDDFVIIDKEAVVGYLDMPEKLNLLGSIQNKYKLLQRGLSNSNPKRYGKDLTKKCIGNELDFLALHKNGNIILIEYKHGTNTSGIYLSPLQIGLYYEIFTNLPRKDFEDAISEMLLQKQRIGLINPNWYKPSFSGKIIPVLIISNYNYRSSAKVKFEEVLQYSRNQLGTDFLSNLETYNYRTVDGLTKW